MRAGSQPRATPGKRAVGGYGESPSRLPAGDARDYILKTFMPFPGVKARDKIRSMYSFAASADAMRLFPLARYAAIAAEKVHPVP